MTSAPEGRKCTGCAFAKWQLTKAGKLHPSGDGRCTWFDANLSDQQVPPVFYYLSCPPGRRQHIPEPCGGFINRREPVVCRFRLDQDDVAPGASAYLRPRDENTTVESGLAYDTVRNLGDRAYQEPRSMDDAEYRGCGR